MITQCSSKVAQCYSTVAQCSSTMTQCYSTLAQCYSTVAQGYSTVARWSTMIPKSSLTINIAVQGLVFDIKIAFKGNREWGIAVRQERFLKAKRERAPREVKRPNLIRVAL
jgi:hypothetical protein